ncbi:hypothetical protein GCM10018787_50580 [Streptomyces thermodiastaticus]|nr:hypothetical protein GCM10018787_50580 [Streptomyces thermodiastaticus]
MSGPAEGRAARPRRAAGAPGAPAGSERPRDSGGTRPAGTGGTHPAQRDGTDERPRDGTRSRDDARPGDEARPRPSGDAAPPRSGAPGDARPPLGGPNPLPQAPRDAAPHDTTPPHAGMQDVNHGPDDPAPDGFGPDELALRRLLHEAVRDVEPREDALERLRRAVPQRRARRRQAVVGMAAAALFLGTAVPALVHVSDQGGAEAEPAMAGRVAQSQGGTGPGKEADGGASLIGGPSAAPAEHGTDDATTHRPPMADSTPGLTVSEGVTAGPSVSAAGVPQCTGAQLGSATATVGTPDGTGVVQGTFRVANVSGTSCTVTGPGTLTTHARGAADASRISVVPHTSGDASGLPDAADEVSGLVLAPGAAYEVKFAWVPSETCSSVPGGGSTGSGGSGSGGETGGPSPGPSPSQDTGAGAGAAPGADQGGSAPQLTGRGGKANGSVEVSHTPETGAPTVSATVPGACAGTVYRTGVLPVS